MSARSTTNPFSLGWGVQLENMADGYYENYLYLASDGDYGHGTCSGPGATIVGGNTIWSPTGNITECGTSLAAWQAKGNDPGTVGKSYPTDLTVLALARQTLNMAQP